MKKIFRERLDHEPLNSPERLKPFQSLSQFKTSHMKILTSAQMQSVLRTYCVGTYVWDMTAQIRHITLPMLMSRPLEDRSLYPKGTRSCLGIAIRRSSGSRAISATTEMRDAKCEMRLRGSLSKQVAWLRCAWYYSFRPKANHGRRLDGPSQAEAVRAIMEGELDQLCHKKAIPCILCTYQVAWDGYEATVGGQYR